MKIPAFLLVGSITANVVLVFLLAGRFPEALSFFSAPRSASATASEFTGPSKTLQLESREKDSPLSRANPQAWTELNRADLAATVARLRAEGVPPALLRAIMRTLISERFEERRKVIVEAIKAQPWWLGATNNFDPKIALLRRQIGGEQEDLLTQLLGPDTDLSDAQRARQQRVYGDLPPEKTAALRRITADYAQMMNDVNTRAQGFMLTEDRAQLTLLEQEQRADIAKLLSPAELAEMDLRSSPTANDLRGRLAAFEPTEQEFRTLFKIQKAIDDQFPSIDTLSVEQRTQRNQALSKVLPQVEAALGPARFAEFKETTDGNFLTANNLVRRFDLPATATREIIAVQKDINQRAEAVRSDRSLAPETRNAQLASLGQEATTRLTPILGNEAFSAYKQGGGSWINSLARPPLPPPAARK